MRRNSRSLSPLLLALLAAGAARALPMAGTMLVEDGMVALQRGRPPRNRRVDDFARIELGDRIKTSGDAEARLSLFDSGGMALEGGVDYLVEPDGVYKSLAPGKVRVYQFSQPLRGSVPDAVAAFLGGVGTAYPEGPVEIRRAGRRAWEDLDEDTEVRYHDSLRTGGEGRVVLVMGDRARLVVEEETVALLQKDAVVLERGGLLTHWRRHGHRFEVHTPLSVVAVRGTVFRVASEPGEGDRVGVHQGRVVVRGRAGRGGRSLGDGMLARVSAAGELGATERVVPPAASRRNARALQKDLAELPRAKERAAVLSRVLDRVHTLDDPRQPLARTRRWRARKAPDAVPAAKGREDRVGRLGAAMPDEERAGEDREPLMAPAVPPPLAPPTSGEPGRSPPSRPAPRRSDAGVGTLQETKGATKTFRGRPEPAAKGWVVTVDGGGESGDEPEAPAEAPPPVAEETPGTARERAAAEAARRRAFMEGGARTRRRPRRARVRRVAPTTAVTTRGVPAPTSGTAAPTSGDGKLATPTTREPTPTRDLRTSPTLDERSSTTRLSDPLGGPVGGADASSLTGMFQL